MTFCKMATSHNDEAITDKCEGLGKQSSRGESCSQRSWLTEYALLAQIVWVTAVQSKVATKLEVVRESGFLSFSRLSFDIGH